MPKSPATSPDSVPIAGDPVAPASGGGESGKEDRSNGMVDPGNEKAEKKAPNALPSVPLAPPKVSEKVKVVPPVIEPEQSGRRRWWSPLVSRQSSSFLASCLFHAVLLTVLGLIVQAVRTGFPQGSLIAYYSSAVPIDSVIGEFERTVDLAKLDRRPDDSTATDQQTVVPDVDLFGEAPSGAGPSPRFGPQPSRPSDWLLAIDAAVGGGLEGRSLEVRKRMIGDGPTGASEAAVERGLRWLVAHQREDGSWNFNHHKGPCQGLCRNPGTVSSTTGATAIALTPFLGAGYTHQQGEYQDTVRRGLYYLVSRALLTSEGVDLQEGTMYAQGLSAIVLCEAYAMTGDPALKDVAQRALDFIDYAQDKRGGGWRYTPGEPGDTTVTGWQLMALKSGQMAGLRVHSPTIFLVDRFLSSVQSEDGAKYGYMDTTSRRTTTAIGLLCRMYTGWRRTNPALKIGVSYLSDWGPSEDDMYYNYYAVQVLRHWEGPQWEKWHPQIRDYLVATQAPSGHEAGSWHFDNRHAQSGGRLYNTAMAVMILEVYYRYMPLYRQQAFGDWD